MYAPGKLQRATRRSLSPTPDGFVRNCGAHYIPLRIPITSGRGTAPAKWVRVRMGVNPVVWGCMYKGGVVYQGDVHTAPVRDHGPTPDYTNEQLLRLHSDYQLRQEVDEALEQMATSRSMRRSRGIAGRWTACNESRKRFGTKRTSCIASRTPIVSWLEGWLKLTPSCASPKKK
jgi:hypothetical protein